MKLIGLLLMALTLGACVAKHSRDMNEGEKTILSSEVKAMLLASEDGELDIREHKEIRCERIRIVGTHMVQRLCFTTDEDAEQTAATQKKYYSRFGAQKNLDRSQATRAGGN